MVLFDMIHQIGLRGLFSTTFVPETLETVGVVSGDDDFSHGDVIEEEMIVEFEEI
jgi:hypothetical protein